MVRKRKWKKFFNKFHVYGGLLTVGFLISFSYSAFVHQHHPKFIKAGEKETHWSQTLEMPPIEDNHEFKLAVRDSLELFGHAPWWEDYRDSLDIHHFMVARPGKSYWITVPAEGNLFHIREVKTGFLNVLTALHPLAAGMQNHGKGPFFIRLWKILSLLLAIVLLLVLIITLHFWITRSFNKKRSWIIVLLISAIPIILIIFIWLVG
jgi:hypothetical protein